ncbi:MAG: hypothetical protein COA44_15155 [Arcobacter sp.]|nr:MAG: hypothetical protein COA44_15155 [Arcobacter sp.]
MCNVGKIDKTARIVGAIALLVAAYFTPYWWLGIAGLFVIGTIVFSFCPMYTLLGINTSCEMKSKDKEKTEETEKKSE